MPEEFSRIIVRSQFGLDAVSYVGPDGKRIIRPPGLFDTPGAVCGPGMVVVVLGLIFCLRSGTRLRKLGAACLVLAGMGAIFLSHVRSGFLVVAGAILLGAVVLASFHGARLKAAWFLGLATLLLLAAFSLAVALGGESTRNRFIGLAEGDFFQLYYAARGNQLEYGFKQLLTEYPLGAGLGRWGMTRLYFGDPANRRSPAIWAELQPNAWILDGGLLLLVLYAGALLASMMANLRLITMVRSRDLRYWAVAVFITNICTIALIASYTPFTSQIGLQYWLLSGALQGAARGAVQEAARGAVQEAARKGVRAA
jgi:hypothetical protein